MRESPALKVISLLEKEGSHVIYNDPYIPTFTLAGKVYNSVLLQLSCLAVLIWL